MGRFIYLFLINHRDNRGYSEETEDRKSDMYFSVVKIYLRHPPPITLNILKSKVWLENRKVKRQLVTSRIYLVTGGILAISGRGDWPVTSNFMDG